MLPHNTCLNPEIEYKSENLDVRYLNLFVWTKRSVIQVILSNPYPKKRSLVVGLIQSVLLWK